MEKHRKTTQEFSSHAHIDECASYLMTKSLFLTFTELCGYFVFLEYFFFCVLHTMKLSKCGIQNSQQTFKFLWNFSKNLQSDKCQCCRAYRSRERDSRERKHTRARIFKSMHRFSKRVDIFLGRR